MSGFDPAWLRLREPADERARDAGLAKRLRQGATGPWRIVDLGCGTGANGRWLAPRLGGEQDWRLVDGDERLLAHSIRRNREWARRSGFVIGQDRDAALRIDSKQFQAVFRPQRMDLRAGLRKTLAGADLITASALLDLVSEAWLAKLIETCGTSDAACLFALSYDGTMAWTPADPFDDIAARLFNEHQRRDKGFGPALGPSAGERATALLRRAGYRVFAASTPWRLTGGERKLQRLLLDGVTVAAREQAPERAEAIEAWAARRRAWIDGGAAMTEVGHADVLGLPAGRPVRS